MRCRDPIAHARAFAVWLLECETYLTDRDSGSVVHDGELESFAGLSATSLPLDVCPNSFYIATGWDGRDERDQRIVNDR